MADQNHNDFSKPHLPTEKTGHFTGDRGNSQFIPNNPKAQEVLKSFGTNAVKYTNGYPDFSPFTQIQDEKLGTVQGKVEIGHMTTDRQNPQYEYGRRTDSHAPEEDLGNFSQADNALAKSLNDRDGTNLTGKDIQQMRERNGMTWHEVEDGKTMCLVPTELHDACPHSGGVSIEKDLHEIADSEDYDFDTGEDNAMDYTYNEEDDELIPVHPEETASEESRPTEDEYAYTGKVDANPQYGNGGATQYFVPHANEMKQDGRLVQRDVQVEDPAARTKSGEPAPVKEYVNENGVRVTLDERPMDPDEWKELEESCPESEAEAIGRAYQAEDLSEEDLAAVSQEMPSDSFYQDYNNEYRHPLTNQENSEGSYSPDGWQEPVTLKEGQVLYQLSVDGDTKSCYFTDQDTIDSCRREDGSIDFDALRDKLQVGNGDDKITLTAYEFKPSLEGEADPELPPETAEPSEEQTKDTAEELPQDEVEDTQKEEKVEDAQKEEEAEDSKKEEEAEEPELQKDDLTVEEPNQTDATGDDEALPTDDLEEENDPDSQTGELPRENLETQDAALDDGTDDLSQLDDTQLDSQDAQQELDQQSGETEQPLARDDLSTDGKKEDEEGEETDAMEEDELTTGDAAQDMPEQDGEDSEAKADTAENTDGNDSEATGETTEHTDGGDGGDGGNRR